MRNLHIDKFDQKVKLMNQRKSKDLRLTVDEAQALHHEIFNLLNQVYGKIPNTTHSEQIQVKIDGGSILDR